MIDALLGPALLALAAAVLLRVWWSKGRRRLARVDDGVFRSGALPPHRLEALVRRLGLATVVDFRRGSPEVDAEAAQLARLGVRHEHIPIGQRLDEPSIERFLAVMQEAPRPVLVHCKHGAGRTPLFAALYLVEQRGVSEAAAFRRCFWPSLRMFAGFWRWRRQGLLVAARQREMGVAPLRQAAVRRRRTRVRLCWHKKSTLTITLALAACWALGWIDQRLLLPGLGLLLTAAAWSIACSGYARPGEDFEPHGPFRIARHPEVHAVLLYGAGALATVPLSWRARAALLGALVIAGALCVRAEDRKLRRRLGARHASWLAGTRAVLPGRPWPVDGAARGGGFDWSRVRRAGGRALVVFQLAALGVLWLRLELTTASLRLAPLLQVAVPGVLLLAAFGTGYVVARARSAGLRPGPSLPATAEP